MAFHRSLALVAGVAVASLAVSCPAAVFLNLRNFDGSTTANVGKNATFDVNVYLTATTPADRISGVDYRVQVNAAGSGQFQLVSRTSSGVIPPYVPDKVAGNNNPAIGPVLLAPTNGATNLGGALNAGDPDLVPATGGTTYYIATLSFRTLATTPNGTYTLSFLPTSSYSGSSDLFNPSLYFSGLGSFAVTVPEPAMLGLAGLAGVALLRRRTK